MMMRWIFDDDVDDVVDDGSLFSNSRYLTYHYSVPCALCTMFPRHIRGACRGDGEDGGGLPKGEPTHESVLSLPSLTYC